MPCAGLPAQGIDLGNARRLTPLPRCTGCPADAEPMMVRSWHRHRLDQNRSGPWLNRAR
jgi:hypothetical protein